MAVQIVKKINNNVALAMVDGQQAIVMGKGIGFKSIPYTANRDEVEKVFYDIKEEYFDMFRDIPAEYLLLTERIMKVYQEKIGKSLNQNIIITLSDHIVAAVERNKQGLELKNPLFWEVQHLFIEEYKVGEEGLNIIEDTMGVRLPSHEAASIALHFINADNGFDDMSETFQMTEVINDILKLVKFHFKKELDHTSYEYTRFVGHLGNLVLRIKQNTTHDDKDSKLYDILLQQYPETMEGVDRIHFYLKSEYGWECSKDELTYLAVHLNRLLDK